MEGLQWVKNYHFYTGLKAVTSHSSSCAILDRLTPVSTSVIRIRVYHETVLSILVQVIKHDKVFCHVVFLSIYSNT